MCTLYKITTSTTAIREAFQANETDFNPNVETSSFYPKSNVPIVVNENGTRNIRIAKWGVPPPPNVKSPIVNVRNLNSPFWRKMLNDPSKRCLVPVSQFCEWYGEIGSKKQAWFSMKDESIFAFAGIYDEFEGEKKMAFLTCEPNELVGKYHPKAMPVILDINNYGRWLSANNYNLDKIVLPYVTTSMIVSK